MHFVQKKKKKVVLQNSAWTKFMIGKYFFYNFDTENDLSFEMFPTSIHLFTSKIDTLDNKL